MTRKDGARTGNARGGRSPGLIVLAAIAALVLMALAAAPAGAFEDFSGEAFQILAPGAEGGVVTGPYSTDQGKLYEKLTLLGPKVTQKALDRDFLSEKFGVQGSVLRTENPKPGLEIVRDSHDIPHIYGATRPDVMYGSGWVAAEDRALLLALGLGPAFTAADGIPGINPFGLLLEQRSFTPSAESVAFVEAQKASLLEKGAKGEQVLADLESWVEGVNGYEESLGGARQLPPLTMADAIAGFAFIGSIFGNGGGNEVADSEFLAELQQKYGQAEGMKIYHDLRESNDPEAPTTGSKEFSYDNEPETEEPGALVVEPGTESSAAVQAAKALKASRKHASNFLLTGAGNSATGHPLAVMGPQLGYFYPEIVFQADLHGPGIDAEGVIAPISPYVFIGRGKDFAWSLTSAGSENTQQFLEKLCNPEGGGVTRESTYYEHDGECIPMHLFDAGLLGAKGSEPARELTFYETVHGPVSGTVMVKGQPYAIANDRADRGREPAGEVAFSELDSDQVHNPTQFFEAANELETTFNMAYVDSQNIAFFSTGRLPVLASGTNPSLPTLGTGAYDWKGFLSLEQHPHEVDPASQVLTNWNNKPAPGWGSASDNWSYGPVHRVQMFNGFHSGMKLVNQVQVMNKAANQDLRGFKTWPVIKQVLAAGSAPSKLAEEAAGVVSSWVEEGAYIKARNATRDPGEAIMDAVWQPLGEAVLSPVLGTLLPQFSGLASADDPPNPGGSSFEAAWYSYVYKDLRTLVGDPVEQPYSRPFCGNGSLSVCSEALWSAIQQAAEHLSAEQGPNPSAWKAPKVKIEFAPGLLKFKMRWTNRSTFQQAIEFTGHAPE